MASHQKARLPVKDVLQILDCNQSDDGSEDDSDSDEPMHSELESDVDVADSDEDFSSSDEEPLSNIANNSSSQTSKKKKPKQWGKGQLKTSEKDNYAHWPVKVNKRGRCKLCEVNNTNKCDVRLCFVEERNCFKSYHV